MNLAHLHLLLNHFPTIGFGIGIGLFFVSLFAKSEELKRASLVILFLIAVIAIPTYLTGAAALDKICDRVLCKDKAAIHVVARIKQNKNVSPRHQGI